MVDQKIKMNTSETLEIDYLVEEVSRDVVTINKEPSGLSESYYSTDTYVFDPSGAGTYEIEIKNQVIEIEVTDIPDSVVSRPDDNTSLSLSRPRGLVIEVKSDFNGVKCRISGNSSGFSRARIYDFSNDQYIETVDISDKNAGDIIELQAELIDGEEYGIELDNDGGSWTGGYNDLADNYPYSGDDLNIVGNADDGTKRTETQSMAINDIGNPN
jgi:hypothetical protein